MCYDGLQISNLACFELLVRRLQHIEQAHIECPTAPDYSGAEHFMGSQERRGGALVAPGLAQHVAGRFRDDASIAKELRKAREARGPTGPAPPGPATPVPRDPKGKGKDKNGNPKGKGKDNPTGLGPRPPDPRR